jgi:hypothetical protein
VISLTRAQVLGFRVRAQQLDRELGSLADTNVLDLGVQDTGADGGLWALVNRGVDVSAVADELATAWTLRGAPHLYRRAELPAVAAAVQPFSEADAGKRILTAAKPLKAAGITNLEALEAVGEAMRGIVTKPMVKGDVSSRLTAELEPPYLRNCQPCKAIHIYEMLFRFGALRAGLDLQNGSSPPVLQPIERFEQANDVPEQFDVIRATLRLLGPSTPKLVAEFLDATLKDVKARWPQDIVEVDVEGEQRSVLAEDEDRLSDKPPRITRLLGPYDLYLQGRDRSILVADAAHAKALWPVLGRPGAVLIDGEIAGTWRPRRSGKRFSLAVDFWSAVPAKRRTEIEAQAERLAAHRGIALTDIEYAE